MRLGGGHSSLLLLIVAAVSLVTAIFLPSHDQLKSKAVKTKISFSRDILPILSDKCFKCHGPDSGARQANMRLDTSQGAFADRGGRYPVVPGKPEDSLMIKRINSTDSPMPPRSSGKSLSQREKDLIRQWIAEGAQYAKLWSFEPLPTSVPVPKVNGNWPRDDLDRFILARLQREKLAPSPPASRPRWLRRVTLDLTGLPPTEAEIAAFEADNRADAFERVVDRLLASPRFGERVAVDWLDAARYSDSYGYQSDLLMPSWPYRDWVVKAFNQNLPYDQFLTDQIAGDLLPSPTRDQRLATAFNRLHRQSNEGGSIALEFKTEYAVDRVSTFGTAVLGLTLGCARCHDHKFDPISQREFYQLFAYFNSIDEYGLLLSTEIVPTPSLLLPTAAQEVRLKELKAKNDSALHELRAVAAAARPRYGQWLAKSPSLSDIPDVVARYSLDSSDADKFANELGGKAMGVKLGKVDLVEGMKGKAVLFDGDNGIAFKGLPGRERWDAFTWSFWIEDPRPVPGPVILMHRTGGTDVGFCGFDLMLDDGYLTARVMRHWPGNAIGVRTKSQVPKDKWSHVAWSWDGSGREAGLKIYIDGRPVETMVLADKLWKKIYAYGDLGPSGGDWAFGQRFRDAGFKGGKLDEVTFATRPLSPLEVAQLYDGSALATALKSPPQHSKELFDYYLAAIDEPAKSAREAVKKSQTDLTNFEEGINEISVMEEAPKDIPAYLLSRGRYDAPRTEANRVARGVPKSLPPLPPGPRTTGALRAASPPSMAGTAMVRTGGTPVPSPGPRTSGVPHNDRLTLAKWATAPSHPLTARVAANRLWQMVFGVGLVETSENFGVQGSQPTHPQLLDFLARQFVNSGWNVKQFLRSLVLSATYRQDSALTPKLIKVDPHNVLYARGPSQRLSAEMVRDTVLAASGLLNAKAGGPPVNPYQPAGIWTENNTMSPGFVQSKGIDLYRRSLYSTWKRTTPVPSMMLFDATSREACTMRRQSTNTPLQALVLLNDIQFVEAARVLAELVLKQKQGDEEGIRTAFRRLSGREPDGRELSILQQTLKEQRAQFAVDPKSAAKLTAVGESKASATPSAVELAAMTVTVQMILNSDAVIWKR